MSKRIVILGAGESGTGAALLATLKGFDVFVSDAGAIAEKFKQQLKQAGIAFEESGHTEEKVLSAHEVIKSPGIPDKVEIVQKIQKRQIPVIDEIEFASRYAQGRFIAITGTNGKTTTTLLTYHLLKESGVNVGLGGNVGFSLARQLAEGMNPDWWVLELSSFQLDGIKNFHANIGVLLNITPDHLDRYEDSMILYTDSKFRVTKNMTNQDVFIYFEEDEYIQQGLKKHEGDYRNSTISLVNKDANAFIENEEIKINEEVAQLRFKAEDLPMQGKHNRMNMSAAILTALHAGISEQEIRAALKTFVNAPHRLEKVATINGVEFINDSKATNVDASFYALDAMKNPIVWIAGGKDKGNEYSLIDKLVKEKVKVLVCMGKDNAKLIKAFEEKVPVVVDTHSIQEAVATAVKHAKKGDVVLLSPACASFDLFKNYEDRGDQFRALVLELKKSSARA